MRQWGGAECSTSRYGAVDPGKPYRRQIATRREQRLPEDGRVRIVPRVDLNGTKWREHANAQTRRPIRSESTDECRERVPVPDGADVREKRELKQVRENRGA